MVTGRLRLRLFSHDEIALMPGEVAQLLRHRSLMAFYLSGIIALIWLNWDQRVPGLPLELHAPPQIGAVLAGGLVPALGLLWADRRARRGHDVVVSASRLFLCAAILGFAGYTLLAVPLGVTPMPSVQETVLDIAFNYLLAEIIAPTRMEELVDTGELNIGVGISKVGSFRLSAFRQPGSLTNLYPRPRFFWP